jgi:hypothetical protein
MIIIKTSSPGEEKNPHEYGSPDYWEWEATQGEVEVQPTMTVQPEIEEPRRDFSQEPAVTPPTQEEVDQIKAWLAETSPETVALYANNPRRLEEIAIEKVVDIKTMQKMQVDDFIRKDKEERVRQAIEQPVEQVPAEQPVEDLPVEQPVEDLQPPPIEEEPLPEDPEELEPVVLDEPTPDLDNELAIPAEQNTKHITVPKESNVAAAMYYEQYQHPSTSERDKENLIKQFLEIEIDNRGKPGPIWEFMQDSFREKGYRTDRLSPLEKGLSPEDKEAQKTHEKMTRAWSHPSMASNPNAPNGPWMWAQMVLSTPGKTDPIGAMRSLGSYLNLGETGIRGRNNLYSRFFDEKDIFNGMIEDNIPKHLKGAAGGDLMFRLLLSRILVPEGEKKAGYIGTPWDGYDLGLALRKSNLRSYDDIVAAESSHPYTASVIGNYLDHIKVVEAILNDSVGGEEYSGIPEGFQGSSMFNAIEYNKKFCKVLRQAFPNDETLGPIKLLKSKKVEYPDQLEPVTVVDPRTVDVSEGIASPVRADPILSYRTGKHDDFVKIRAMNRMISPYRKGGAAYEEYKEEYGEGPERRLAEVARDMGVDIDIDPVDGLNKFKPGQSNFIDKQVVLTPQGELSPGQLRLWLEEKPKVRTEGFIEETKGREETEDTELSFDNEGEYADPGDDPIEYADPIEGVKERDIADEPVPVPPPKVPNLSKKKSPLFVMRTPLGQGMAKDRVRSKGTDSEAIREAFGIIDETYENFDQRNLKFNEDKNKLPGHGGVTVYKVSDEMKEAAAPLPVDEGIKASLPSAIPAPPDGEGKIGFVVGQVKKYVFILPVVSEEVFEKGIAADHAAQLARRDVTRMFGISPVENLTDLNITESIKRKCMGREGTASPYGKESARVSGKNLSQYEAREYAIRTLFDESINEVTSKNLERLNQEGMAQSKMDDIEYLVRDSLSMDRFYNEEEGNYKKMKSMEIGFTRPLLAEILSENYGFIDDPKQFQATRKKDTNKNVFNGILLAMDKIIADWDPGRGEKEQTKAWLAHALSGLFFQPGKDTGWDRLTPMNIGQLILGARDQVPINNYFREESKQHGFENILSKIELDSFPKNKYPHYAMTKLINEALADLILTAEKKGGTEAKALVHQLRLVKIALSARFMVKAA